ncbi:MAG: DUF433 domain-containing protein [Xanthobacteraceae bacterium]|jgi:uncharacterized protein (DUF433 family)
MPRIKRLFTTAEAADLAESQPGAIEKAIEDGIVEVRKAPAPMAGARPRRLLSAEGIYYVAFLKLCDLHFSKAHRQRLWSWFKETPPERLLTARWHLSPGIDIRPGELLAAVRDRVTWYARARDRWIEQNPGIKGGTPVVKGTRVSVYSIRGRIDHGDTVEDVLEDNPDLPRDAIEAALAYARANPLIGRPGGRPWQA